MADLDQRISAIEKQLVAVRVLEEANAEQIKLIWEGHGAKHDSHTATLDAHTATLDRHTAILETHSAILEAHSAKLDQIARAVEPIAQIRDFIDRVAAEHEHRLLALEKHTGLHE
jgi:hypothetical protein